MTDNYASIIAENLRQLYSHRKEDLAAILPAEQDGNSHTFKAFGETCRISPEGISLDGRNESGVLGILISLYARHARPVPQIIEPLRSFKELPNSMPYAGAFTTHTESPLVPRVDRIDAAQKRIIKFLDGKADAHPASGDFSFVVQPLPKIALMYIFYHADDEFPASATCLYSNNAVEFMPIDGLADVGEYTSKKILALLDQEK